MTTNGGDRETSVQNRQLQKELSYRVNTDERLGKLQEGQKSLETKIDSLIALMTAGKSISTEERTQSEAQEAPIHPPGVPTRQGAFTSAIPAANSQVRPQECLDSQIQPPGVLMRQGAITMVIPPTNLQVTSPQEAVISQQQWQFVPQFQDEPYSWCYDRAYPDPYLHPDTGDGSDYPRIQLESITRYQQQNYSHSYSAYGQFHGCGVNFPAYDGVNRLRNHNGISAGLRNLDYDRNSVGCVDVVAQEPSSIVSQTEFSSSPGKVDLELSISNSRNKVGGSLEFENEAKILDKEELDADLQAIDEGMELPQEMRVNVEAFCNLKTKEHEVSVECDAEFSVVNQKKMVSIGKSDELEVKNSDVWRKVDLLVHCGIKEVKMQDNNVDNSVDISATVSNHFSKTIELNHLEMVVVLGRKCLEDPASYKLLVMGGVLIVQGAIQWDFKKYKKKCLAVRGGNGSTTNYNIFSIFLTFQLYS